MIVVSDTSPLRALAHLGLLPLLGDLYGVVLVPPAVVSELANSPAELPSIEITSLTFIRVQGPSDPNIVRQLRRTLDAGESEALALALEVGADAVLVVERQARAEAVRLGMRPLGVLGFLSRCKSEHRIPALKPLIERLRKEIGFFVADSLVERFLNDVGE